MAVAVEEMDVGFLKDLLSFEVVCYYTCRCDAVHLGGDFTTFPFHWKSWKHAWNNKENKEKSWPKFDCKIWMPWSISYISSLKQSWWIYTTH